MIPKDLKWFAYLCVQKGLITPDICRQIGDALGERADLLLFAETIIANNLADKDAIQELIDNAWKKAQGTLPPPRDVFNPPQPTMKKIEMSDTGIGEPTAEVHFGHEELAAGAPEAKPVAPPTAGASPSHAPHSIEEMNPDETAGGTTKLSLPPPAKPVFSRSESA